VIAKVAENPIKIWQETKKVLLLQSQKAGVA
jgi:hypothetical protein